MCRLKKKIKQKFPAYKRRDTPPEASVCKDAAAVVWGKDKKSFGEIFFENGAYKYACWQLCYDEDFVGYYWAPIYSRFASFFDTPKKAKQAAEDILQGYPPKT